MRRRMSRRIRSRTQAMMMVQMVIMRIKKIKKLQIM